MILIQKTPTYNNFFRQIELANGEIILCAPYIKKEIVNKILDKKKPKTSLIVVTSSNLSNFATNSSDIEAIGALLDNNIVVRNYQNLHAKIFLFEKVAMITSANLTNSGMLVNYEYGVLIKDDEETIKQISDDFTSMFSSDLCGSFTKEDIKYLKKTINHFGPKTAVNVDKDGDNIILVNNLSDITNGLNGWQKDVFDVLIAIPNQEFSLNDVYSLKSILVKKHPSNHNVEPKIRQTLQYLRDKGLVKFVASGHYKKFWMVS